MSKIVISDGRYFASGTFVCQRAHVVHENGVETEISPNRPICQVSEGLHDRVGMAHRIAIALNDQFVPGVQ